jgi:hypothetical protein
MYMKHLVSNNIGGWFPLFDTRAAHAVEIGAGSGIAIPEIWPACIPLLPVVVPLKPGRHGVKIVETRYTPLWVDCYLEQGRYHYRIIKLTGSEYQDSDPFVDVPARQRMSEVFNETKELMNDWARKHMSEKQDLPFKSLRVHV